MQREMFCFYFIYRQKSLVTFAKKRILARIFWRGAKQSLLSQSIRHNFLFGDGADSGNDCDAHAGADGCGDGVDDEGSSDFFFPRG